jgi:hypothetical protein
MDPKELRGLMEAYSEVYSPKENIEEGLRSAVKRLLGGGKKEAEAPKPESRGDQLRARYNVGPEKSDTSAKRKILDRAKGNAERAQKQVDMGNASQSYASKAKDAHNKYLKAGYSKYGADAPYQGRGNKARKRAAALNAEDFEFIVNALIEEGYDLSSYTWDEMYDICLDENRMASRMEKMPSAPAKVGKATHSIKDISPSKPPTPEEKTKARKALGLGEAVKGESSERRRDLAAQRRAGDKPLSPAKGRDNANKMQRDINYFDKLTKKNKNVVGLVSNEEVENYDEGYMPPTQKKADKMMKQSSKLHRTGSERGDFGHPEAEKKHTQASKIAFMSRRMSDKAKEKDAEAKKSEFNVKEDIYDIILSHLLDEGYAETLEEAEWLMANVIDEEAIGIVIGEAQAARNNPEKYEREQSKKSAPVRGERTPMPPRGDKRREDFEKWYAANGPK